MGLTAQLNPSGLVDSDRLMGPLNPLAPLKLMSILTVPPAWSEALCGSAMVKSGGPTVSDKVVERLAPPPKALIVTVLVPRAAEAVAEKETMTTHGGLHGLFVNVAVTPLRKSDVQNVTRVVTPLERLSVMENA